MAYMRGEWYIFGSRDHIEIYGPTSTDKAPDSVLIPYDVADEFVVMRYHDLPWRERIRLGRQAYKKHGRPEPIFWRLSRALHLNWLTWKFRRWDDDE